MEIGKTFCGRTDGRTHLSSNLLGHRRGDDLKIVKQQYLHISSLYGEFRHTNGWDQLASLGIPANFNGYMLASLLHRYRSTEVNQTLHDVWPSLGLVHYIHILGGSCPLTEFCKVQNSLSVQVLHCSVTTWNSSSGRQPNFVAWNKEGNYGTFAPCLRRATIMFCPHSSTL